MYQVPKFPLYKTYFKTKHCYRTSYSTLTLLYICYISNLIIKLLFFSLQIHDKVNTHLQST